GLAGATAQANRGKPARHCEAHSPAGERHGGRASRGRGRHGNEGPGGATAGDDRKMNNEPLEREPIDRVRARLEALLKANAAPRCGARSKRTGKPCRGAAMPNGRCRLHGGKSTGPRTREGLERSRRANWKHGHFSREAKAERSRVRAAILAAGQTGIDANGKVAEGSRAQGGIDVLIQVAEGDPQARIEVAAFLRSLQELGWSEGRIMTQQLILKRASADRPMRAWLGTIMSDRDRTDDITPRRPRT